MITLPQLPYDVDALEPFISKRTVEFHYFKHHQGYVNKLNELIAGTEFENLPLETIIMRTHGNPEYTAIFNNAAQVWNHNFYWQSLSPNAQKPSEELKAKLAETFGSFEELCKLLKEKAVAQFGSGYVWLCKDQKGNLLVSTTSNAENPLVWGHIPLLTIDVWEHAYYLDYQNLRADYLQKIIDNLLDWQNIGQHC